MAHRTSHSTRPAKHTVTAEQTREQLELISVELRITHTTGDTVTEWQGQSQKQRIGGTTI